MIVKPPPPLSPAILVSTYMPSWQPAACSLQLHVSIHKPKVLVAHFIHHSQIVSETKYHRLNLCCYLWSTPTTFTHARPWLPYYTSEDVCACRSFCNRHSTLLICFLVFFYQKCGRKSMVVCRWFIIFHFRHHLPQKTRVLSITILPL